MKKPFQVVKRIKFPGDGNAWHINCLNVINGKICISAFNICDDDFGWGKTPTKGTGFIMDIQTKEKIWDGLSMPHNPYEFGNKIAVCNSETKSVLFRDKDGDIEEVLFDGFTRGLQFSGRYMVVGISTNRTDNIGNAKVAVYDTVNKEIVREIVLPFPEIYSVCLIEKGKFSNIPLPINNLFLEKNLIIDAYKSRQYMSLLTEQKPLNTHKLKVGLTVEHISKKMKINTDYELTVKVENHNDMTMQSIMPFPINMAYHWKNIDGTYAIYDGDRTPLITPLFPFSYTDIGMRLKTPATPGNYVLEISMVQESLFWFEKYCDNLPESVEISVEE